MFNFVSSTSSRILSMSASCRGAPNADKPHGYETLTLTTKQGQACRLTQTTILILIPYTPFLVSRFSVATPSQYQERLSLCKAIFAHLADRPVPDVLQQLLPVRVRRILAHEQRPICWPRSADECATAAYISATAAWST